MEREPTQLTPINIYIYNIISFRSLFRGEAGIELLDRVLNGWMRETREQGPGSLPEINGGAPALGRRGI